MAGIAISYGYRTMINAPFYQFRIWMPTWNNPDSFCTISLYKWEGNLTATLEGEAIAEETFDPMGYDSWRTVEFDEQEAGEYLIYIYDCGGSPGLYKVNEDVMSQNNLEIKGYTYIDGGEASQPHVPHLKIYTVEPYDGEDLFGECSPEVDTPADETTAEETTAEETTAPETTASETTAPETTASDTTVADTTIADTTVADTTVADTTVAGTDADTVAGTKAPATTAVASEGCKAVVGSMSAIALVAVASAAAVVLKKKED